MNTFISKDGQQLGPFSEAEVREKLKSAEIAYTDYCYQEGWTDWRFVKDVFPPAVLPPPPAPALPPTPQAQQTLQPIAPAASTPTNKARRIAYVIMGICVLDFLLAYAHLNFLPQLIIFANKDWTNATACLACLCFINISKTRESRMKVTELITQLLQQNEAIILVLKDGARIKIGKLTNEFGTLVATNQRLLFIKAGEISGLTEKTTTWLEQPELKFSLPICTLKNITKGFNHITFSDAEGITRNIKVGLRHASKWASILKSNTSK